jgi:RNA polymerase sigma factor (sigma-70 family)
MTVKEFADKMGYSVQTIYRWVNMRAYPKRPETINKICQMLKLPEEDIFPVETKSRDFLDLKKEVTFYKEIDSDTLLSGQVARQLVAPPDDNKHYMIDNLREAIEALSYRERDVLKKVYGIDCEPCHIDEIAKEYRLSRQTVYNTVKKAKQRLKIPRVRRYIMTEKESL